MGNAVSTANFGYFCVMEMHEKYMGRCIELAKNGLGTTYPNPLVGSVIVYEDRIIGEGWHRKSGEPHAEVNAVNSVKDRALLQQATIYVSLEPCSHFGKTPPCCDLIIANGIPNIVIGTVDPNIKVSGEGIRRLKEAGKNVTVGILENECRELNKRFFTFHNKKRPYIILKWAQSADGFMAPLAKNEQKPVWISNVYSRQLAHKWRSEEQGILVGAQTVIDDNPKLDVRDWTGNNPVRIVLAQSHRITKESFIFGNESKTIGYSASSDSHKLTAMQLAGRLFDDGIESVIVEGGKQTLQTFIEAGIWDEARIFKGPNALHDGIKAPVLTKAAAAKRFILEDELLIFYHHD